MILPKIRDPRFITVRRGGSLQDDDHHLLAIWAVRIGPTSDPGGRGCEIGLSEGDHVILGVVDVTGGLNSLATAVWFVAPDGSLSSPGSLWEAAADVRELRNMLREALPDTAVPVPRSELAPLYLLLGFMTLAVLASLVRSRRWLGG